MKYQNDSPQIQNWIKSILDNSELEMIQSEGYSVKEGAITGIFERIRLDYPLTEFKQNQMVRIIQDILKSNEREWLGKIQLSRQLDVPLFLILWNDHADQYLIFQISSENSSFTVDFQQKINSCYDLSIWLKHFKGITVSKKFIEQNRLPLIDECLRRNGVPWPGNLDAFWHNNKQNKILSIFEFSRTRKTPVSTHDVNRFFKQDVYRLKPLDILRQQLNVPLFLILWSSGESVIKIHEIGHIDYLGNNGLEYKTSELIEKYDVYNFFNELYTKLSNK